MIYKKVVIQMLLIGILILVGCSSGVQDKSNNDSQLPVVQTPSPTDVKQPEKERDPIKEQLKNMTLDEKLGQLVIVGIDGYSLDENARRMIENYHVGGFILFGRNVKDSDQLLSLVNALKRANAQNKVPLFMSVDEEGGRVSRMPEEIIELPTNGMVGKVNSGDFSYKIGGILAEEIKSFGFSINFAPILDINSNPENPVIGDRSFGADPKVVSKLGVQTMKGIQERGVIPVVKHFPGHGDTSVDSHIGLPAVNNDIERLKSFELIPFKDAIKNRAEAVMVAHILLNKIDPDNPASLSKTIITDVLRKQMNFEGIVVTDDMTMGAIAKNYSISDAAVKSINAGADIVLVCHGYDNETAVLNALKKAVENGAITDQRVDESVYRILELKQKYKVSNNTIDSVDVEKINEKISGVLNSR